MAQHQRVAHIVVQVFVTTLTLRNFNFLARRTGKKLYANFNRVAYHEWIRTIDCTKRNFTTRYKEGKHYFHGKVDSESGKFFKQIFIFKEIEFGGRRRVNTDLQRGFSF